MTNHTDLIERLRMLSACYKVAPNIHDDWAREAADALAAQAKRIDELTEAGLRMHDQWTLEAQNAKQFEEERDAALTDLKFVERWANHHATKPTCTAEAALSVIQHYPPIKAITRSYADGKVPDTPDPWAALDAALARVKRLEDALRDLLEGSERHIFHTECLEQREAARAALAEGDKP